MRGQAKARVIISLKPFSSWASRVFLLWSLSESSFLYYGSPNRVHHLASNQIDAANRYPARNFTFHDYTSTPHFSPAAGSDPLISVSLDLMTTREILRNAQRARWEWTRRLGFYKYVGLFGVLSWGLPMFLLMTFFMSPHPQPPPSLFFILFSAVLWLCGGICIGWLTWRSAEKKFKGNATDEGSAKV
jgi:hypothetical protein